MLTKEQIDRLTYKPGRENFWRRYDKLTSEEKEMFDKAGLGNTLCLWSDGTAKPMEFSDLIAPKEFVLLKPDYVPEREEKTLREAIMDDLGKYINLNEENSKCVVKDSVRGLQEAMVFKIKAEATESIAERISHVLNKFEF